VPQIVMVVEVLVAERDRKHPLSNQRRHRVLDRVLPATIAKAPGKPGDQTDRTIGRAEKQRSRVRRHQRGVKGRIHSAPFHDSKIKPFCATLCRHRGAPRIIRKSLRHNNFR
jgi:hypothetical protein